MNLGFTGKIARASAARPWLTIALWAVGLAVAGVASTQVGNVLSQEERYLTTVESETAYEISDAARLDEDAAIVETVVVTSAEHTFADEAFQSDLATVVSSLESLDGVESVSAPTLEAPMPVSETGSTALVTVTLATDHPEGLGEQINATLTALDLGSVDAYPYGNESANAAYNELAENGMVKGEIIGVSAALVILVVVFGALMASWIPLVVGGVAIIAAIGATAIVGQVFELSFFITNMISMMGLALGIDYSLVIVQRFREELAHGRSVRDAVSVAGDTASRAVFFSGLTVLVSLAGLLLVPFTVMVSLGSGAMIVAVMAVLAALTLLPAILQLLGHRINKGRLPMAHPGAEPRAWRTIARSVMRRPLLGTVAGLAILLTIAFPALSMRLVFPGIESLPSDMPLRLAVETLSSEFGYGDSTTLVAIETAGDARGEVEALADAIEADPAFAQTSVQWVGDEAFIDTKDALNSTDPAAEAAVHNLRDVVIPEYLDGTDAVAHVGGAVAGMLDFNQLISDSAPWVALVVLGSCVILLLVTFRSVVVAFTAVVLNALSTLAAYGVLVAIFQWGWAADALGLTTTGGITPWLPIFLFAVLFGLSMDYHVFLLSRIKERFVSTGNSKEAVEFGLSKTGSLITGAALIMVAVFSGFALGDLAQFSHMGVGLAVAIIIDATVIRTLLVPSLMALLGDRNWYLPSWLRWIPAVHIEAPSTASRASDEVNATPGQGVEEPSLREQARLLAGATSNG